LGVEHPNQRHAVMICRTCPRDAAVAAGQAVNPGGIAAELRHALVDHYGAAPDLDILLVHCLGACTRPCAAALSGPDKWRLRFERLSRALITPFIAAVRDYRALATDGLDLAWLSPALRPNVGARSPPPRRPIGPPNATTIPMGGDTP
jgi:predicted metal-binding protein